MNDGGPAGPRLTAAGCIGRRASLVESTDVDLIVITNPRHLHYYANFHHDEPSLFSWGRTFLLIDAATAQTTLLTSNWARAAAERATVDRRVIWKWYDSATDAATLHFPEAARQLREAIDERAPTSVGVEAGWFPALRTLPDSEASVPRKPARLVDITATIEQQRRAKCDDELELIRFALRVTEAGFAQARRTVRPGMTELELYAVIQSAMTAAAGAPVALIGDFLSGERTRKVGGPATHRVIRAGDPLILDMGPVVNGYRGDFTCTFTVGAEPPARQRELEGALHEAMSAGEALLLPGTPCRDVYAAVKAAIAARGFGDAFGHHAGHGLGLGHPEAPFFVPGSEQRLEAGDVVTLEPGAYGEDFAGRIEHIFHVTPDGPVRLTGHSTSFSL